METGGGHETITNHIYRRHFGGGHAFNERLLRHHRFRFRKGMGFERQYIYHFPSPDPGVPRLLGRERHLSSRRARLRPLHYVFVRQGPPFTAAMVRGLERVGMCFLGACLSFLLLAIYLAVNMQLAALFLLFFLLAALLAAAALFFFLLADAVDEGRMLREENDLTI